MCTFLVFGGGSGGAFRVEIDFIVPVIEHILNVHRNVLGRVLAANGNRNPTAVCRRHFKHRLEIVH